MSSNSKDSFGTFGMLLFAVSFIGVSIFFVYVVVINPGGVDTGVFDVPIQFSKAQADERTTSWKETSAENVTYGEHLYKVNCTVCHVQANKDMVQERLLNGSLKFGNTPLALYRTVRKGFDGQHRFDYIPEKEKWALVAYMRSKMPNAPDDSASAWRTFLKEGMY